MNITLPKTIAEPNAIPWPAVIPGYEEMAKRIIEHLHKFFMDSSRAKYLPSNQFERWSESEYSVAELLDCFELIALDEGAETAKAREISVILGDRFFKRIGRGKTIHTGFCYRVEFTIPQTNRTYWTEMSHKFGEAQ